MGRSRRKFSGIQVYSIILALMLSFFAAGCKKKPPVVAAPPPPAPAKIETPAPERPVIATFEAEPRTIERGQSATLRWSITGEATDISITPGIGAVTKAGQRQVFPGQTQTYTLTAKGPGGDANMNVSITVTSPVAPTAPPPSTAKPQLTISEILNQQVQDALFDYDSSSIREDARSVLTRNADALKSLFGQYPNANITVEGHADERGSAEYNLGLADRRATAAKEFLVQLGVTGDRLNPVSFGKERPQCTESTESCWQLNRRAHFSPGQ
ncbi:MAG TPA: OmpA family protein [Bryobacteraceae bacterium]|nr:OmpA family protein [Bryobacteraceae bacterium]